MIWTHHIAGEPDDLIQCCIICGLEIHNYTNAMVPIGHHLPFWNAGDIYIGGKNPQVTMTTLPNDIDDEVINCKP